MIVAEYLSNRAAMRGVRLKGLSACYDKLLCQAAQHLLWTVGSSSFKQLSTDCAEKTSLCCISQ